MIGRQATRVFRVSLAFVFAFCACLAGCALLRPSLPKAETTVLLPGEILSAQAAKDGISIGTSTKSDVAAALGQGTVIPFDSGYEVWVYREKEKEKPQGSAPRPRTELVLLFAPSGIVSKTRIR